MGMAGRRTAGVVALAVAAVLVVALAVAGAGFGLITLRSGDADEPGAATSTGARPLTEEEANRLAVTRFRNHEAGARDVTLTVPTPSGPVTLDGVVDFEKHVGYGVLTGGGSEAVALVQWTLDSVILQPWPTGTAAPVEPPKDGWQGRSLTGSGSSLDTALLIVLNLAGDRPENAQLLNQNGAAWLRRATVDGEKVDVVRGPGTESAGRTVESRTRFWLTGDGTSVRVEVDLESAEEPVVVALGASVGAVTPVPGLLDRR